MNGKYRIGIDAGTSAFKAALIDEAGNTLATGEKQLELVRKDSTVEMDAISYKNALYELLGKVAGNYADDIAGIAISGAAGSTLMLDKNDKPSEIISWLDKRWEGRIPECLNGISEEELRQRTGWPCLKSFPLAHIAWWQLNKPEQLNNAKWIGLCTDYLIFSLCGRNAMDFSTATTMHLVDQQSRTYCLDYIDRLGIRREQLSPLMPSGTYMGELTDEASQATGIAKGTKVFTGAFDHPSAARGCNIKTEDEMLLSCGTSWVAFVPIANRDWIISHRLLCDPFLSTEGGPYGAMFSIEGLGQKIDKLVTEHFSYGTEDKYSLFNQLAEAAGDACIDEIDMLADTVPALPKERLARAIMNGCAAFFARHLAKLELPVKTRRVVLAGGPAKSRIWPSIIQKYTQFNIEVTDSFTGARGAAKFVCP